MSTRRMLDSLPNELKTTIARKCFEADQNYKELMKEMSGWEQLHRDITRLISDNARIHGHSIYNLSLVSKNWREITAPWIFRVRKRFLNFQLCDIADLDVTTLVEAPRRQGSRPNLRPLRQSTSLRVLRRGGLGPCLCFLPLLPSEYSPSSIGNFCSTHVSLSRVNQLQAFDSPIRSGFVGIPGSSATRCDPSSVRPNH